MSFNSQIIKNRLHFLYYYFWRIIVFTKKDFLLAKHCQKAIWLSQHSPESKGPEDPIVQMRYHQKNVVVQHARSLFESGHIIDSTTIDTAVNETKQFISQEEDCVLFDAHFLVDDCLAVIDVLERKDGKYYLYNIRNMSIFKRSYAKEIAYDSWVLSKFGITMYRCNVIYINPDYHYRHKLNLKRSFFIRNVSEDVLKRQRHIEKAVTEVRQLLRETDEPEVSLGTYCKRPFPCPFHGYCFKDIPNHSVFTIKGLELQKKFELANNQVIDITDVKQHIKLTEKQEIQCEAELSGNHYVDKEKLALFLDKLVYPRVYLDFEAIQSPIPLWEDTIPFQQIPFQFSIHIQHAKGAELEHIEYLTEAKGDPRYDLVAPLLKSLPEIGSIIAYNSSFEGQVFSELAQLAPRHKWFFKNSRSRLVDLMEPFFKQYIYLREMEGGNSIKKIAPALIDNFSYDDLPIAHGEMASQSFQHFLHCDDVHEKDRLKQDLLTYCKYDTLAMALIVDKLETYLS